MLGRESGSLFRQPLFALMRGAFDSLKIDSLLLTQSPGIPKINCLLFKARLVAVVLGRAWDCRGRTWTVESADHLQEVEVS